MRIRAIITALATSTVLVACGGTSGGVDDNPPSGSNADDSSASDEKSDDETEEPSEPEQPKFGDTYSWDNGLSVTISKPKQFQPSEYAAMGKGTPLRFTVTVVNKTGAPYKPLMDYITLQSGNAEAEQIFDSENGLNGSPSTTLLEGREAKYDIGFTVKNPKDLVMEFSAQGNDDMFSMDSALFTN
jgi:hypothetical protein